MAKISINSIHDILNKKFDSHTCNVLSKKESVSKKLIEIRNSIPKLSHYLNLSDLLYVLSRIHNINEIDNFPVCEWCGKICRLGNRYEKDNIDFSGSCYDKVCSNNYKIKRMNETIAKKYGVTNISKLDSVKESKKKSALLKYGVDNVFKHDEIKEKIKETLISKYGVDNISKSDEIKKKKLHTAISNFGSMKNYIDSTFGSFCKKVAVGNASQLDFVKDKKMLSFLKHYGKINCFQDEKIKEKIKKYWEDNSEKRKMVILKSTTNMWNNKNNIINHHKLLTGIEECEILNDIEKNLNLTIDRQVSCMQYYIDGYIFDYNIAIEYDEPSGHSSDENIKYDIQRQKEICDYLGCIFIRIKQIDWYCNKQKCLDLIQNMIKISSDLNLKDKVIKTISANSTIRVKKRIGES